MSSKYGLSWKRYKWLATAWVALGQQDRALATLEQMLTQFPCDAYALAQTAQLKEKRGDTVGAISDYELLLQQSGAHDGVWITLGTLHFQNDVLDRAEVCFRKATTLDIEHSLLC
jgi:tetratricopeptide (TPR) repeat protein